MLVIKNKFHTMPESAKSAIIYTLSTLFSRGLAIITVPIFTRLMTTDQIGEVNLYNSWYSMISVIATLSLIFPSFLFVVAISKVLETADKKIQLLKAKSENLKQIKRWLMQQLLTGKVKVNVK